MFDAKGSVCVRRNQISMRFIELERERTKKKKYARNHIHECDTACTALRAREKEIAIDDGFFPRLALTIHFEYYIRIERKR